MSDKLKVNLLKYAMWAASIGLPLGADYVAGMKGLAGAAFLSLLLREFDKQVIEPYETEVKNTPTGDTVDNATPTSFPPEA